MPVHKVDGGWQWGGHGKVYKSKEKAQKQAAAAFANGWTGDSDEGDFLGAGICFLTPEGKSLFLKKAKNKEWGFPGGHRDGDETPLQTAQRETLEEAGALPYGDIVQGTINDEGDERYFTFIQHIMFEFEPVLSDEHTDYIWATLEDAPFPLIKKAEQTVKELSTLAEDRGIYNDMKHFRDNEGRFASSGHHGAIPKSELKEPLAQKESLKTMFDPDAIYFHSEELDFENLNHINGGIYFAAEKGKTQGVEVFGKQPMAEYQLRRDKLFDCRRKYITDENKEVLEKVINDVFSQEDIKKFKEESRAN